ncbi:MAG TPA: carboxylesterase/lipase family protein [Chloroflexia bacterium]|nr:carboxylesterase/lipase family protein [Chloroflexia bacterium]
MVAITQANPVVATRHGKVRGAAAGGISAFKGIPYAAPPFGPNRLLPPRPVEPWSGVRDALAFGPKSPQPEYPNFVQAVIPPETCGMGEDCLNLNIWSPDLGAAGLPVMVWLPGGVYGYHGTGASPCYDGTHFARDGVVLVTINYRVAADGFLYLDDGNTNRGMLDQIAALQWVRDNIAAFGGDPGKVTIFGESAGAMSAGTLLPLPRAEGLFRRAILQSGAAHNVISAESARLVARRFAQVLGVEPAREAVAAVPIDRLLAAQVQTEGDLGARPDPELWGADVVGPLMPWQPVVDGDLIPARPIDLVAAGAGAGIDLLAGCNTEENRLFLLAAGALDYITEEALAMTVAAYGLPVESTLASYRSAYPGASPGDLMAAVQGDWMWRIPAAHLADAHAPGPASTYMYEFAWRSPQFDGRLGAGHSVEIPFVFDTLDSGTEHLLGADPPQSLADTMHAAWVAFASTGECPWPKYDLARRATMRFDLEPRVMDDPLSWERRLWEGVR